MSPTPCCPLPYPCACAPPPPWGEGGEALPGTELPPTLHTPTPGPQRPLLRRAQTLDAEKPAMALEHLSHHTGREPTPNLFGVLCPYSCGSVLGLEAFEL